MKMIKRLFAGTIGFAVMLTGALGLFGCKDDNTNALTFAKAYDYSAIAGIGLLNTKTATGGGVQGQALNIGTLDQAQKAELIGNLAIAQNLADNGIVRTDVTEADRDGYTYCYTVTATDYTGAEKQYTFYYNQTDITDAEDLRENERELRLDGLVILDGVEYQMIGTQEIENKETEFTFKVAIDQNNYVMIEQETETNEIEFKYTAFMQGVKVFETEVEYEIDRNGNIELEFGIMDKENNVLKEYEYEFYKVGEELFARIKIKDGNQGIVFAIVKITATQNGFEYTFVTP